MTIYIKLGVKIIKDEKEILNDADLFIQLGLPSDEKLSFFKEGQSVIGVLNPYQNKDKLNELKKNKSIFFRVIAENNRAQSMDILSSQANLAGYKAVMTLFFF